MFIIRNFILLITLIFSFSAVAADADFVIRNGKLMQPVSGFNLNGVRTWYNITDGCFSHEYCAKFDEHSRHVKDPNFNIRTQAPVPATINSGVPKKTVYRNLLENARKFKKIGGGWFGIAFGIVGPLLADEGYEWLEEQQDFVRRAKGNTACLSADLLKSAPNMLGYHTFNDCLAAPDHFLSKTDNASLNAACNKFGLALGYQSGFSSYSSLFGGICDARGVLAVVRITAEPIPITQNEFDRIVQPHADQSPSSYVNASRPEQNANVPGMREPVITVSDGFSAVSNPYTNPVTGVPEQKRFDFSTTNNVTNVTVTVVQRPDLASNSEEAPVPNAEPEVKEDLPPDGPFDLCKEHPEILACQKLGEPDASVFDDIKIPHVTDNVTYTKDLLFPETGVCPAPKTFTVSGRQFSLSYEPICGFLEQIRFAVLGVFIFVSMGIVFGSLKGSS